MGVQGGHRFGICMQPHVYDSQLLLQDDQPLHMGWHWISDKLQTGTYLFPQFYISLHHLCLWKCMGTLEGYRRRLYEV